MSEGFNPKEYRDKLAKDLKTIGDHGERAKALESEQGSWRYMSAEEKHLIAVGEHPEKVRQERLKEIVNEKLIAPRVKDKVGEILNKIEKDGRPFYEEESYYSNSSHCQWHESYSALKWLGDNDDAVKGETTWGANVIMGNRVRRVARRSSDGEIQQLPINLEKFAIIGYMLSAIADEIDYDKNPDRWFHLPLGGARVTLNNFVRNGNADAGGSPEESKEFSADERINRIATTIDNILAKQEECVMRDGRGAFKGYDPVKRAAVLADLGSLRGELINLGSDLAKKIIAEVDLLTQKLEEEEAELKNEE